MASNDLLVGYLTQDCIEEQNKVSGFIIKGALLDSLTQYRPSFPKVAVLALERLRTWFIYEAGYLSTPNLAIGRLKKLFSKVSKEWQMQQEQQQLSRCTYNKRQMWIGKMHQLFPWTSLYLDCSWKMLSTRVSFILVNSLQIWLKHCLWNPIKLATLMVSKKISWINAHNLFVLKKLIRTWSHWQLSWEIKNGLRLFSIS